MLSTTAYVPLDKFKKHPAFILGIVSDYFVYHQTDIDGELRDTFDVGLNHFSTETWLAEAQSYLVIREREYLDNCVNPGSKYRGDVRYRQILPYLIVRQLREDGTYLYYPYRRTVKVGESRLAGNVSIGYGGHIDLEDIVQTKSVIDLKSTILLAALREAEEEFVITDSSGVELSIDDHSLLQFGDEFIIDDSNEVGMLHLGLIMVLEVPAGCTVATREDELTTMAPATAQDLLAIKTVEGVEAGLESWTAIYLKAAVADDLPTSTLNVGETSVEVDAKEVADTLASQAAAAGCPYHQAISAEKSV